MPCPQPGQKASGRPRDGYIFLVSYSFVQLNTVNTSLELITVPSVLLRGTTVQGVITLDLAQQLPLVHLWDDNLF